LSVTDLPVDLPQARTREAEDERNVSITLSTGGAIAVDEDIIERADLTPTLRARLAQDQNRGVLVVVRADSSVPFRSVQEILTEARAAGATRLALATRQKTEAKP
jgi:biopolymer transport protein ExbD